MMYNENPLNKLAVQFADSNRQEQKWLREEIKQLREIISALLTKHADCVTISKSSLDMVKDNSEFEIEYDTKNMVYRLTYKDKYGR